MWLQRLIPFLHHPKTPTEVWTMLFALLFLVLMTWSSVETFFSYRKNRQYWRLRDAAFVWALTLLCWSYALWWMIEG